jgi:hypothetical protein
MATWGLKNKETDEIVDTFESRSEARENKKKHLTVVRVEDDDYDAYDYEDAEAIEDEWLDTEEDDEEFIAKNASVREDYHNLSTSKWNLSDAPLSLSEAYFNFSEDQWTLSDHKWNISNTIRMTKVWPGLFCKP